MTSLVDAEALFNGVPGAYLVLSPALVIEGASEGYLRATSTRREQIVGRGLFEVFPDGRLELKASLERVLSLGQADSRVERFRSFSNHPLKDKAGKVLHILHHLEDVTGPGPDVYAVFEHLMEGVQVLDFEGRYLYLNDAAIRHSHSDRQALLGARMVDRYPGIEQTPFFGLLQACLTQRSHHRMVNPFTYPDGRQGTFELYLRPIPAGALIFSFDISIRVELEERLRQAERMESVGRLAGGVAHDFNNLLTIMVGFAELLRGGLPSKAEEEEALSQILAAGSRAAEMTRQLLAFSRGQILRPQLVELNAVVAEVSGMLLRLLGSEIEVEVDLCSEHQMLMADSGQLHQVVLNLALNARDAMPTGGHLFIRTQSLRLEPGAEALEGSARPGEYALLSVRDSGQGMDDDTRHRLFEPFFSTKGPARGSGLGLATVHGIVRQSGGWIAVESAPGKGACFNIYLPMVEAPFEQAKPPVAEPLAAKASHSILLVDDQVEVLKLFEQVLQRAGYQVQSAKDAREALAACQGRAQGFDLLLSDLSLPDKNGRRLAEEVRALYPQIRVLYSSGYSEAGDNMDGLKAGESFIGKPVAPSRLLRAVDQILKR